MASEIKGGFIVNIGINAFLPISQVDIKPVKNPASFVGRHLKFKVIKVNKSKGNVIVSRRMLLEEERERKKLRNQPVKMVLCQVRWSPIQTIATYIPAIQEVLRRHGFPNG